MSRCSSAHRILQSICFPIGSYKYIEPILIEDQSKAVVSSRSGVCVRYIYAHSLAGELSDQARVRALV